MNDIAMMALQHHPGEEWLRRGIDHFDRLYAEGEKSARVMAISVHPYISGVPHRIGYLERLYEYILQRPEVKMLDGRTDPRLVPACRQAMTSSGGGRSSSCPR